MQIPTVLQSYAAQLGYPDSERMAKILTSLFDNEDKLKIIGALPGTLQEISQKSGLPLERTKEVINELHATGAVNERGREETDYRLFPGIIELRDAVVLTPGINLEIVSLFNDLIHEELPEIIPAMVKMGVPPMMRVIPIEESVESQNAILDIESARKILTDADQVVAIPCVCRKTAKELGKSPDCPAPDDINLCLMINEFGREAMSRGIGEKLSTAEAVSRLEKAEEAGLVHMTRNNVKKDMIMCNCCECCCTGLFIKNKLNFDSFAPSRFRAKLDEDACIGCGTCEERCPFMAIEVGDIACIDPDKCYGCGVCVSTCPSDALVLEEIRPKDHIRIT